MGNNAFDKQPEERAASGPDSTLSPPRVGLLSLLSVSSIGADIFISYRRHEAKAYALELRRQLENRSYRCFLDEALLPTGVQVENYKKAARRSRMFVLVGSSTIFDSQHVPRELAAYREGHLGWLSRRWMRILPINVAGALSEIESPAASDKFKNTPWFPLAGLICEPETELALQAGVPSKSVVDRIDQSFTLVRSAFMLLFSVVVLAALVALGTGTAIGVSVRAANRRLAVAQGKLTGLDVELKKKTDELTVKEDELKKKTTQLDERGQELLEAQTAVAEAEKSLAGLQTELSGAEAEVESARAETGVERARAASARKTADEQQRIAFSRRLAGQATSYEDRQRDLSLLLNAEAYRNSPTFEARSGLLGGLLTYPHLTSVRREHNGPVLAFASSPDRRVLVSSGMDGSLVFWDAERRAPVGCRILLPALSQFAQASGRGSRERAIRLGFRGDGRLLFTSNQPGEHTSLWNVEARRITSEVAEHAIGFTPDGKLVTYQQKDDSVETTVNVWDTTDEAAPTPTGVGVALDIAGPDAVALSADGRLVAMADAESGDIVLVDLVAKARAGEPLKGHTSAVATLLFTKDGKTLVSADADNTVRVWSPETGRQLTNPAADAGTFIALSEDEKLLAAAREDGAIKLLDFIPVMRGDLGDLDEHRMWNKLRPYRPGVNSIMFGPGKETLITGNADGTFTFWSLKDEHVLEEELAVKSRAGVFDEGYALSYDGRTLAVNESGTAITLLDAKTKKTVKTIPEPHPAAQYRDDVKTMAFAPKGRKLAVAYSYMSSLKRNLLMLWDISADPVPYHLSAEGQKEIEKLTFSRDGKLLASTDREDKVIIYDVSAPQGARAETERRVSTKATHKFAAVGGVAFSPDGGMVAVGVSDGSILLWDWRRGPEAVRPLEGHAGAVVALAFGASDRELVSIDSFGRIISWSDGLEKASPAAPPDLKQEWSAHATDSEAKDVVGDYGVSHASFSGDGKTLILTEGNRSKELLHLWDVEARAHLASLTNKFTARALYLDETGDTLFSDFAGGLSLWDFSFATLRGRVCQSVGRNLTRAEWEQFAGRSGYHTVCPDNPAPVECLNQTAAERPTLKGLIGTWEGSGEIMLFNADGTVISKGETYKYYVLGRSLVISSVTGGFPARINFHLQGDTLVITSGDEKTVFKRKPSSAPCP